MRMRAKGSYQPSVMKDRFKGSSSVSAPSASRRNWDEGAPKDYEGAPIAPAKGRKGQVQDAAKISQGKVEHPGRTSPDSPKPERDLGYPMTGAPKYTGLAGGHGPKPGRKLSPGPIQSGKTKGRDSSPARMKDRFKGRSHGM